MKKIISNILKRWYIYLITIAFSAGLTSYIANLINQPRNEETISLFVASTSIDTNKLETKLEENKPDYLREVEVHSVIYYANEFDYVYSAFGKELSDIIILPESKCFGEVIQYYYTSIDVSYIESYIGSPSYYTYNDVKLGIKIHSKGQANSELIQFKNDEHDEDYFMFFGKKSLHAGKNNDSNWNTCMDFAKIILEN